MTNIEFFKLQAKNLFSDYKSRMYNDSDGTYDYFPRFFTDINDIIFNFEIDEEEPFTLMNAQHVIARLAGFYKWTELIKASEPGLELGKLLLTNRIDYLKNVPIITNDESMIVEDWKFFLAENDLQDCDDETKLNIFKDYFLQQDKIIKQLRKEKISIDFSNDAKAQDMLVAIMKEKNLTPEKAILSSITQKIFVRIIETGWGQVALPMWRHDNPYKKLEKLDDPVVKIKLSKDKERLVSVIMEKENVHFKTAIMYFMLFTLESLGYHIYIFKILANKLVFFIE